METLYIKLYEKYSKLKAAKYAELAKTNENQEVRFLEFVSAAETLIEHLTDEKKRLCQNMDELRGELLSLRVAKDQQFGEFVQRLEEEKQKNQKLSAEIEQLHNMQHEGIFHSNRSERHEIQHVNNMECSPCVSGDQSIESPKRMSRKRASECSPRVSGDQSIESPRRMSRKRASECSPRGSGDQFNESPTRMTRKRARLFAATDSAINNPPISPLVELATGRGLSADHPKRGLSDKHSPLPECCRINIDSGGPCTRLFQKLVECLIGMKVSVVDQPERMCIRVIHQSSGYSFSLTWMNKTAVDGEVMYNVSSLGTFATIAPEWMREVIIFSMNMFPIFFERVTRVIQQH